MRCAIWYHLYNLKNAKNALGGMLILVKLQASASNFTKINTPPWVFFPFFKLYKWYQTAQRTTYVNFLLGIWKWKGIFNNDGTTSISFPLNASLIKFGANCYRPNKIHCCDFIELKMIFWFGD